MIKNIQKTSPNSFLSFCFDLKRLIENDFLNNVNKIQTMFELIEVKNYNWTLFTKTMLSPTINLSQQDLELFLLSLKAQKKSYNFIITHLNDFQKSHLNGQLLLILQKAISWKNINSHILDLYSMRSQAVNKKINSFFNHFQNYILVGTITSFFTYFFLKDITNNFCTQSLSNEYRYINKSSSINVAVEPETIANANINFLYNNTFQLEHSAQVPFNQMTSSLQRWAQYYASQHRRQANSVIEIPLSTIRSHAIMGQTVNQSSHNQEINNINFQFFPVNFCPAQITLDLKKNLKEFNFNKIPGVNKFIEKSIAEIHLQNDINWPLNNICLEGQVKLHTFEFGPQITGIVTLEANNDFSINNRNSPMNTSFNTSVQLVKVFNKSNLKCVATLDKQSLHFNFTSVNSSQNPNKLSKVHDVQLNPFPFASITPNLPTIEPSQEASTSSASTTPIDTQPANSKRKQNKRKKTPLGLTTQNTVVQSSQQLTSNSNNSTNFDIDLFITAAFFLYGIFLVSSELIKIVPNILNLKKFFILQLALLNTQLKDIRTEIMTEFQNQIPQTSSMPTNFVNAFNNNHSSVFIYVENITETTSSITIKVFLTNDVFECVYVTTTENGTNIKNLYEKWQNLIAQLQFIKNQLHSTFVNDSRIICGLLLFLLSALYYKGWRNMAKPLIESTTQVINSTTQVINWIGVLALLFYFKKLILKLIIYGINGGLFPEDPDNFIFIMGTPINPNPSGGSNSSEIGHLSQSSFISNVVEPLPGTPSMHRDPLSQVDYWPFNYQPPFKPKSSRANILKKGPPFKFYKK